ncbi:hypothetical protein PF011_g11006 [Phytophthora fragariae]|uniref:Uncharacterized protein n=1 Tax=Phytophthora fragariae TaxID=53985 RepID=A0A6A3KL32_9STRA|nr:hypothetical protein PF011_g11006 [Phytophthora fragariae]
MGKASFTSNPYPKLVLSETDRAELLQLAENLIVEVFPKYESFVVNDKRVVKNEVTKMDALPAACDQAEGYQAYNVMASLSGSDVLSDDFDC